MLKTDYIRTAKNVKQEHPWEKPNFRFFSSLPRFQMIELYLAQYLRHSIFKALQLLVENVSKSFSFSSSLPRFQMIQLYKWGVLYSKISMSQPTPSDRTTNLQPVKLVATGRVFPSAQAVFKVAVTFPWAAAGHDGHVIDGRVWVVTRPNLGFKRHLERGEKQIEMWVFGCLGFEQHLERGKKPRLKCGCLGFEQHLKKGKKVPSPLISSTT
jgi:hypothetical protein